MVGSIYQQITYLDPVYYDWAKIKLPTLVLGGDNEVPTFPELAKHIADSIPSATPTTPSTTGDNFPKAALGAPPARWTSTAMGKASGSRSAAASTVARARPTRPS